MADEAQETPRPFDVAIIEALVRLMAQNDLSEVDLHDGTQRIRLRRGSRVATIATPMPLPAATVHSTATPTTPATAPPPSNLIEIKSEVVGTFYAQKEAGAPPYVKIGARVTPETVIGLIEAMKVYSEILAGVSGVIREIVVKDGEYIDFEKVLFRVDPSA